MTPKQLFSRLETLLKATVWTGSSNKVFGDSVFVVPELPLQQLSSLRLPAAFLQDMGGNAYDQHDQLFAQNFAVTVMLENLGNRYGESVLLSGNRPDSDKSPGAGLLDIELVLYEELRQVETLSGSKITLKDKSRARLSKVSNNFPLVYRTTTFTCMVSTDTGSAPAHTEILRSPGFLYWEPTDAAGGSYGTLLGYLANGVLVDPGYKTFSLASAESGDTPQTIYYSGNEVRVVSEFYNYNANSLARVFLGMTTANKISIPNSKKSGTDFAALAGKLLFVPDDTTNNMAVMLFKAVPLASNSYELARGKDTAFRCAFSALPDASNRILYMGPVAEVPA